MTLFVLCELLFHIWKALCYYFRKMVFSSACLSSDFSLVLTNFTSRIDFFVKSGSCWIHVSYSLLVLNMSLGMWSPGSVLSLGSDTLSSYYLFGLHRLLIEKLLLSMHFISRSRQAISCYWSALLVEFWWILFHHFFPLMVYAYFWRTKIM